MRSFLKYIIFPTVILAALILAGIVTTARYLYQEDTFVVYTRALEKEVVWQEPRHPSLSFVFSAIKFFYVPDPSQNFETISSQDITPHLLNNPPLNVGPSPARKAAAPVSAFSKISVTTESEFLNALNSARAGDVIVIAPGDYHFKRYNIGLLNKGFKDHPITLRAEKLGDVTLKLDTLEGFFVTGAYWKIENLIIEGNCRYDGHCEHAFHIVGNAHHITIKNNIVKNFNAHIKINGLSGRNPDYGLIAHNIFYNDAPRKTSSSVTLIDSVAASHWRVKGNIIADFAKLYGDHTSYGGFFKGGGKSNIFERNLIMCQWRHQGGTRLGLSFGGGGTGAAYCPNNDCSTEHYNGIIRNNIIMNCPRDVGIYLNRSADTIINNNILYHTHGIDVRFDTTTARIFNNVIDGRVRNRDGGFHQATNNIISFFSAATLSSIVNEIYQNPRLGNFDIQDVTKLKKQGVSARNLGKGICGQKHENRESDIGPFNLQTKTSCQMNLDFIEKYIGP